MEEIARESGRYRPKWDERRGNTAWLKHSLSRAADAQRTTYDPAYYERKKIKRNELIAGWERWSKVYKHETERIGKVHRAFLQTAYNGTFEESVESAVEFYAGQIALAKLAGVSQSTVSRFMDRLGEYGIERLTEGKRNQGCSTYRLSPVNTNGAFQNPT